jgi:hypothetical protein
MATINVEHMIPIFPTRDRPEENERLRIVALGGIKRHAEWLRSSARQIHECVQMLKYLPEWETLAEAALVEARSALEDAIHDVDMEIMALKSLKKVERRDD